MDNPKISVLIPMYNRKQYAAQCIDSALNQTFQDYEIVIRDDCSTDGVFEFIQEKYAQQISEGKIRLLKNKENIKEFRTVCNLIQDGRGKYFTVLHNDDILLPQALQNYYTVADHFKADVVHCSYTLFMLVYIKDGVEHNLQPRLTCWENNPASNGQIMKVPYESKFRFNDWYNNGTFCDFQFNLFNKQFFMEELFQDFVHLNLDLLNLLWIMKSKIFIKIPLPSHIRRNAPDSASNKKRDVSFIKNFITGKLHANYIWNTTLSKIEFFRKNPEWIYLAQIRTMARSHFTQITTHNFYQDGITSELNEAVENAFKEVFGENYLYPTILFHFANLSGISSKVENSVFNDLLKNFHERFMLNKSLQDQFSSPPPPSEMA